jgi:hypothetical protein
MYLPGFKVVGKSRSAWVSTGFDERHQPLIIEHILSLVVVRRRGHVDEDIRQPLLASEDVRICQADVASVRGLFGSFQLMPKVYCAS